MQDNNQNRAESPIIAEPQTTSQEQPVPIPAASPVQPQNNAMTIVLQWLTYAFWGWTVLAMSVLTATVMTNILDKQYDSDDFTAYAIAAVLVLLPISLITDIFYSKKEPLKKVGVATVVMVIHAVIFALFGIGALITIVISLVSMFVSSSETTGQQVALATGFVVLLLYIATFARTLNPEQLPFVRRAFHIFMVVIVGLITVLGLVGPVAKARSTKTDRLIETNIHSVENDIEQYARSKDRLPDSLDQLTLSGDAKKLVDQDLVKYKPNTIEPTSSLKTSGNYLNSKTIVNASKNKNDTFYYELCVNFKKESSDRSSYYSSYDSLDGYSTYINTSNHKAGENCYKLKTLGY